MKTKEIKSRLETWGISQQWLADQLDVSKALVSHWMNGTQNMPENKRRQAEEVLSKLPKKV